MEGNQIWSIISLVFGVSLMLLSLIFALLKDKAAILISGFNTLSRDEREKYDKRKMSADMRNSLFVWAAILLSGSLLSYLISYFFAIAAFAVWLVLFFREVKSTPEKAFSKYKV